MSDPLPALTSQEQPLRSAGYECATAGLIKAIYARPRLTRWLLGGPVTLIATLAIMAGMTVWWPKGAAGIDQIGMPLILSPVIWVCAFICALLEERLGRAVLVMLGIIVGNGVLLAMG